MLANISMKPIRSCLTILFIFSVLFVGSCFNLFAASTINVQGKLTDTKSNPITGIKDLYFRIYNSDSIVAAPLWTEQQQVNLGNDGLFNVRLGEVASLDTLSFDKQLYLGISVNGENEMMPRQVLTSSPYALGSIGDFSVGKKLLVGGGIRLYNDLLFSGDGTIQIANGTQPLRFFMNSVEKMRLEQNGNVGIGTVNPAGKLDVVGGYTFLGGLRINGLDAATNEIWNANESLGITVNKTGGGQTGIYLEAGTGKVGIGTVSPGYPLHVKGGSIWQGTIMADSSSGYTSLGISSGGIRKWSLYNHPGTTPADSLLLANAGGGDLLSITQAGNVGIGTVNPAGKLDVVGGYTFLGGLRINGLDAATNEIWNANESLGITVNKTGGGQTGIYLEAGTGKVGIGTASPREKLEVNGNIIADGLNVGNNKTLKLKYYQTGGLGRGTHELGVQGTPVAFKWDPGGAGWEETRVELIVGDRGFQAERDGLGANIPGGILCKVEGGKAYVDFIEIWYLGLE